VSDWKISLSGLARMPALLERLAPTFSGERARMRPAADSFSFVEHLWHLADLEEEGFAERIRLLLAEDRPVLPDFDGARIARERGYLGRHPGEGLARFSLARDRNLAALSGLTAAERAREGTQEGVGSITLGDLPGRMLEHDRSHETELDDLLRFVDAS
jgi:hypothetical protein